MKSYMRYKKLHNEHTQEATISAPKPKEENS